VAETEGVSATEEDLDAEIEKTAKQYQQDLEKFKKTLKEDEISYIKDGIIVQKTIDFLVESSVVK
jgi:trigger factor